MHKQLQSEAQSMHANPMGIDIKGDGGIMKRVLRAGSGIAGRPPADALCKVHYTGWLMDGTRFDSSRDRIGHPFVKLGSGTELSWLAAAVATMNRGELAEYVCRAEYAYGAKGWKGVGNKWLVPPCSTVRWEVELYSWKGFTGNFSTMSDAEMMDQAYALKSQGTEYVRNCMYSEARERYHEACELIESPKFNVAEQLLSGRVAEAEILLLSCQLNEAFCELKREEYVAALRLCDKVLAKPSRLTDEQKVKALYRSYQAYFGRQEYEQAMASLQLALEIDPNDKDVLDAVLSTKFTMRVAKLAQTAQFGGKFFSEESPDRSAALYKEATGIPSRPSARHGALPTAWLDLSVDAKVIGRVTIELFARQAPKTCENFRALCTGERGNGRLSMKPLHLQGTRFHRVIRNFLIQGGDIVHGDGKGGESIFGGQFDDEDLTGKFDAPGMVAMANGGRNMNGSQFFITTCEAPHLEGTHVVFGRVISGLEVVRQVERVRVSKNDAPLQPVLIDDCGSSFGVIPHGAVPPL
jgi:cyclophilin family peptidyl-prolyl cis-trans isomerase